MKRDTYIHFIETLVAYYERRIPETKTLDLWYEKLHGIPDEAVDWIVDKIMAEQGGFPRNLVAMAWGLYYEWRQANPDQRDILPLRHCQWCGGTGLLHARILRSNFGNYQYKYMFRCGHCKQSSVDGWPMATVQMLEQEGYAVNKYNI